MIQMEINVDPVRFAQLMMQLNGMATPNFRGNVLANGMRRVGEMVTRELQASVTNDILHIRTSNLRDSIDYRLVGTSSDVTVWVGSGALHNKPLVYAGIHEHGGFIRPKTRKFLRIPIRAGSPEAIKMGLWNYKRGPRMGQAKKRISFSSKVIKYIFVKQVYIPARHYLSNTLARCHGRVLGIIESSIERQMRDIK